MRRTSAFPLAILFLAAAAAAQGRFRLPVLDPGLSSPSASDYQPTLAADQLTAWWSSNRAGGLGGQDIWTATRPSIASPWGTPVNEGVLNSASGDMYICVSGDGLEMFISTNRPGGAGGDDIWVATRPTPASPWSAPVFVPELNTAGTEDDPALTADNLEIFFTSNRAGSLGTWDLWRSTRPDRNSPWTPPVRVVELATTYADHSPAVSDDGLTLFFCSTQPGGGGSSSDWWVAVRPDRNSPFGTAVPVPELNTVTWDFNGDLTSDEFSFYTSNSTLGSNDIFRADGILPRTVSSGPARAGLPWSVWARRDPNTDIGAVAMSAVRIPPLPIPGITGNLELGFPFFILAIGAMDPNGRVSFSVGAVPPAIGSIIYFQSLAQDQGGQLYLGNVHAANIIP